MQAYQFICGNRGYFSLQIKPDAVEKRLIIIQVSGFQLLITLADARTSRSVRRLCSCPEVSPT